MSQTQSVSAMTWPPERFFWAVIEAPGIRGGVVPAGLEQPLQDELPVHIETLHAVGVPINDGRLLVCAAPLSDLESISQEVLSLRPESLPSGLEHVSQEVHAPEMLVATMEPLLLRRERSRRTMILAASILLASSLLSVGLLRRAQELSVESRTARAATAATIKQVSPGNNPLSLQRDLQQLRANKSPSQPIAPTDAAATLEALLDAWPKGVECETSNVSITPSTVSLSLTVTGDVRPLLSALNAPEGWSREEPRFNTTGSSTRINLTLKRVEGAKR